jgi:putative holliday junction resolvase
MANAGVTQGRVLGLDLGEARIGVSISDPDRRIAVPIGTVQVGRPPGELKAIASIVADNDAVLVVLGLPISMGGGSGPSARRAQDFAEVLRDAVPVPVVLQDERLSTVEAERALHEAGVKGRDLRRVVDSSAATVILQAWLDENG